MKFAELLTCDVNDGSPNTTRLPARFPAPVTRVEKLIVCHVLSPRRYDPIFAVPLPSRAVAAPLTCDANHASPTAPPLPARSPAPVTRVEKLSVCHVLSPRRYDPIFAVPLPSRAVAIVPLVMSPAACVCEGRSPATSVAH